MCGLDSCLSSHLEIESESEERKTYMNNQPKAKCIFCGSEGNITREHAISKNLFPDNYSKGVLITLPSCKDCNESYSRDEELFRLFLVNQSTERSRVAMDMLHGKITRAMKKAPGKAINVLKKMSPVKFKNPDGGLENKVAFYVSAEDWKGHHRVLDKYVKALFYKHMGVAIPAHHQITHVFVSDPSKIPNDVKAALRWNLDHEHIYVYAFACVPSTLQSTWTFVFYDTVIFQSFTAAPGDLTN